MLRRFIEERCGRPSTAVERMQQNYISAPYIQSKFSTRKVTKPFRERSHNPPQKHSQPQAAVFVVSELHHEKIIKQNERMGSLVIEEKEKRKKMQNDMGLIRLAFQSLQNINAKLVKKLPVEELTEEDDQQPNEMVTTEDGEVLPVIRPKRAKSSKPSLSVCTQTQFVEEEVYNAASMNAKITELERQNDHLRQQKIRLEQTLNFLGRQLDENKSTIKKAMTRERHSIQNLRKFSEEVGITDTKLQQFIKESFISKQFELGGVDASTSEVFREHILYLMYLMNNQQTNHERTAAQLRQQLGLEIGMKEQFQRELLICRESFRVIKEHLPNVQPPSCRRELLRLTTPLEQLWP